MTRPEDFPHLGFDPAPGDLDTVRRLVAAVGRVGDEGGTAQTELNKIGSTEGIWAGKAADAFNESVVEIPPYLRKALTSLNTAHRALSSWETSLSSFQTRARRLEREAEAAAGRVSSTKAALDGVPSDTAGMTDKEKDDLEKDKKGKNTAHTTAVDELEEIRGRARTLHAEFSSEADGAARQIRNAADDAPPEPGWFEEALGAIGDFLEAAWDTITDPNFWKLVGDLLADIAMVIGIICLLALPFGGIAGLALIGLWVGAGAFAAHAIALAGGAEGMTWQTLAWDAAGVFAGGVGLAGARLAQSGRVMVQAGRNLRATQGLAATLGRIGPGGWGNIARIPSGMANSMRGFAMAGRGWTAVASGTALDWGATAAGASFALGSNMNDGRWTDGTWNVSDIPVVGPISAFTQYERPKPDVMAPGPQGPQLDVPASLTSAGDSFSRGLDPSRLGTAA